MYGLPNNVCVVPVMSEVICSFRSFESSPHVVYFCDFSYYVVGSEPAVGVHLTLWYIVMFSLISVMSPPLALCNLLVRTVVKLCTFVLLWEGVWFPGL